MLDFIRGLFSKDKLLRKKDKMFKKYDIIVYDDSLEPGVKAEKVTGIMSDNLQMLEKVYAQCDERIEIVREYEDNETRAKNEALRNPPKQPPQPTPQQQNHAAVPQNFQQPQTVQQSVGQPTPQMVHQYVEKKQTEPARFFDIGGIKCKMENGKMFQKQWMRLSDSEAAEFRIVSDKNNKICPIKDKHIEIMKWVLVQNSEDEGKNDKATEEKKELELING